MATFDFVVDTDPMVRKIDEVTTGVGAVGAAVTAMQVAVIASEKKATEKICRSVDNGFYMLLRSKISQRVSEFASVMNSRVGSMMETASSIDHTHKQMQGDFNRIKSRYMKLFGTLDKNLEERVRELDREAMLLASEREEFFAQACAEAPAALFFAVDLHNVTLKASSARLKAHARDSIDELRTGTHQIMDYDQMTQHVMVEAQDDQDAQEYVPVVYTIEEAQSSEGSFFMNVRTPEELDTQSKDAIAKGVRRSAASLGGSSPQEMNAVRTAYMQLIAEKGLDARVSNAMEMLFDASFSNRMGGAR
jgi:hypothetical protein